MGIRGVHLLLYTPEAEALRAALRDALGWDDYVDAHGGWLIFALPPGELAVHPGPGWAGEIGQHELFLMCHDLEGTVAELEAKGVEFVAPISDEGFGWMTRFRIPGAGEIGLYEPRHESPLAGFAPSPGRTESVDRGGDAGGSS